MSLKIRTAEREDVPVIMALIRELAAFEELSHAVRASEEDLLRTGFSGRPYFECLLAEWSGEPIGFALFFHNYSTFEGRPGIYLEDLFVKPEARGKGAGKALLARLAALAVERDCRRLELSVLNWNPAQDFYRALGMTQMEEWLPYRLSGEALFSLAALDEAGADS